MAGNESRTLQAGKVKLRLIFWLQAASLSRIATEPCDHVYGLLNLLPPGHGIDLVYRLPVRDVYIDWTIRAIKKTAASSWLPSLAERNATDTASALSQRTSICPHGSQTYIQWPAFLVTWLNPKGG